MGGKVSRTAVASVSAMCGSMFRPKQLTTAISFSKALPDHKIQKTIPQGSVPLVIVSPGSFSPPTLQHLRLFEEAKDALERQSQLYTVVGGFLSPVHAAYGKSSLAPPEHRLAMVEAAVSDSEWLVADGWETRQSDFTPTALVMQRFASELKKIPISVGTDAPQTGLIKTVMLCGGDLLQSFAAVAQDGSPIWTSDHLEIILGENKVVCVSRDEADLEHFVRTHPVLQRYRGNVTLVKPRVTTGISSTVVRQHLAAGESIRYLVPEAVRSYIYEHRLQELPQWRP